MKAVTYKKYGSADVIQISELEKPVPKDNEILVKVHEAVVTPAEIAMRSGKPFMVRLFAGLNRPKGIAGSEMSGVVEAVGESVTKFKPGDPIYGSTGNASGAQAQYICLKEDGILMKKPENLDFKQATGICDGGLTSLTFLRDIAKVQRGDKVLINGATGSVGSFGVMLAKYFGAEVTAVCSTKNFGLASELGADKTIDYKLEDFTENGETYDIIYDAVGKSSFRKVKDSLSAKGLYLTTVPTNIAMWQTIWTRFFSKKKVIFAATGLNMTKEKIQYLNSLIETGIVSPVIDRHYPLEQVADAHRYVELGHKRGNVILSIG